MTKEDDRRQKKVNRIKDRISRKESQIAKLQREIKDLEREEFEILLKLKASCTHEKFTSSRTANSGTLVDDCLGCGRSRVHYHSNPFDLRSKVRAGPWQFHRKRTF